MVLAGGQGERLYPLTRDRSKPAVPFGGIYRVVDFTLSNCLELGAPEDLRAHPVQARGSLERHLRSAGALCSPRAGRVDLRRAAPAPAAAALVPGDGRRDLPERPPPGAGAAPPRRRPVRATTSTRWTSRPSRSPRDTGASPPSRRWTCRWKRPGVRVLAVDERVAHRGLPGEAEEPEPHPGHPDARPRQHGRLRLRHARRSCAPWSRTRACHAPRLRPRHPALVWCAGPRFCAYPFVDPAGDPSTGATSGRWIPSIGPSLDLLRGATGLPTSLSTGSPSGPFPASSPRL